MRVLISAFGFSPYRGSEAAVGWNIARELAKLHEVTVITGAVRAGVNDWERYLKDRGPVQGLTVEYVEPNWLVRLCDRLHNIPGGWGLYYLAYNLWQRQAYRVARNLNQKRPFDLVHQLNMIGYREPGYMWKLGIPFVWGPVGGGPNEPIAYHKLFSRTGCVKVFLRTVCNEVQKRICWRARSAAQRAVKIWAVTEADYRMIRNIWGVECETMVETGTVLRDEGHARDWDGKSPLRIVWSGIHTSRKALPILILAIARLRDEGRFGDLAECISVDVLGEGPETGNWKKLARRAGVFETFNWHGRLPHDQALKVMNAGQVFAFPSLKEGTPHVVLEALSLGMPVICHDACGMGTVVNEKCGVKIPMLHPDASIAGFAAAISDIMLNPGRISELSSGALARAHELTWEAKAKLISQTYEEVLNG